MEQEAVASDDTLLRYRQFMYTIPTNMYPSCRNKNYIRFAHQRPGQIVDYALVRGCGLRDRMYMNISLHVKLATIKHELPKVKGEKMSNNFTLYCSLSVIGGVSHTRRPAH